MPEPHQRDFLDPAVLGKLLGLSLNARTPMLGNVSGRHRSPIRGSAIEFAQYRKYVPGDDTRRLDWRTWGRIDTSGSMGYGDPGSTRLDYARRLGGTLAYLAGQQGDAVGLYSASVGFQRDTPPRRGPHHLGLVLDQIGGLKAEGETGLVRAIHEAAEKISQRALVVILSDFLFPPEPLREAFQHLRFRKHDVSVYHLLDRQEIDFHFDRPTRFLDLEGGDSILADPTLIQRRYREAVGQYLATMDDIVNHSAVDYHRTFLDEPYDQVLARFLMGRNPKTARTAR